MLIELALLIAFVAAMGAIMVKVYKWRQNACAVQTSPRNALKQGVR